MSTNMHALAWPCQPRGSSNGYERLASEILLLLPGAQLFTNGSYGSPQDAAANGVKVGPSWNPATEATFDTGVIAVGETVSACVWVEDED